MDGIVGNYIIITMSLPISILNHLPNLPKLENQVGRIVARLRSQIHKPPWPGKIEQINLNNV